MARSLRRIMREHVLQPRRGRCYAITMDGDHDSSTFPDLARNMVATGPNHRWVVDLTYFTMATGVVFFAAMDAWSFRVVGYAISRSMAMGNHTAHIAAANLFVTPTIGFNLLYALVILSLEWRRLVWASVTANPTAE